MRILIIGNSLDKTGGLSFYNTESKLALGLIRRGHLVHLFSAREYSKTNSFFGFQKNREDAADRKFFDLAHSLMPELILFTYSCAVSTKALAQYKSEYPTVRFAQLCPDILADQKNVAKVKERSVLTDATFVTTAGSILDQFAIHANRPRFIPNPVDAAIETQRAFSSTTQAFDVFWAARTNVGKFDDDPRETFATAIRESGDISISWYGSGGAAPVFGTEYYLALARAKMALNINADHLGPQGRASLPHEIYHYSSARIAQVIGSGLLAISKRDTKLFEIFPEDEMMVFADSVEEVLEKIRFLKRHDDIRQKIAERAWSFYHRHYTSDIIGDFIIEHTFEQPFTRSYQWLDH